MCCEEEALHVGRRSCELKPASLNAYNSPNLVNYLAMIYVWIGETDLALQTLAQLAHAKVCISSDTRYGSRKLDPQWVIRASRRWSFHSDRSLGALLLRVGRQRRG